MKAKSAISISTGEGEMAAGENGVAMKYRHAAENRRRKSNGVNGSRSSENISQPSIWRGNHHRLKKISTMSAYRGVISNG